MALGRSQWVLLTTGAVVAAALAVSIVFLDLEDEALETQKENESMILLLGKIRSTMDCLPKSYMRWLWWPIILYLFWGMGFICDVYFVRTIEVIAERFQIPDDVAGATLMALGCNGPEMALNTISIFQPSDIGVGAVIGGEVFNVLVIIGTALLATPVVYMPLKVGVFAFMRDACFYLLSVVLLYFILKDKVVTLTEALVLIFGAVCYSCTVTFSTQVRDVLDVIWLRVSPLFTSPFRRVSAGIARLQRRRSSGHGVNGLAFDAVDDLINDSSDDENEDSMLKELQRAERIGQWLAACRSTDPTQGSVLGVRAEVRSRIADRTHHFEQRYVLLKEEVLMVSAAVGPQQDNKMHMQKEIEDLMVYDYDSHTKHHHWHYGGLVNQLIYLNDPEAERIITGRSRAKSAAEQTPPTSDNDFSRTVSSGDSCPNSPKTSNMAPLLVKRQQESPSRQKIQEDLPQTVTVCDLMDAPWEVIPLEDILYIEPPCDPDADYTFTIHVHQHDSSLGTMITLEMEAAEGNVLQAWVDEVSSNIKKLRRQHTHLKEKGIMADFVEWLEWCQFPVKWGLRMTIPDMDNHSKQHLYPLAFVGSMAWLALFAYFVTAACDGLHSDFNISNDVLGFTIAAAGTSFPNVFSGMVVAQQGKTTMAIANALGANVQNVFLALAIPWTIRSIMEGGKFTLAVKDLRGSIIMCYVTLAPVLLVCFAHKFKFPKWSGWLFLIVYACYLVLAIGQETTDCAFWPMECKGQLKDRY